MTFQPLAKADIMKLTERGAASLNSMVFLSRALISETAVNSALRGMLMPGGGLQIRSSVPFYVGGGEVGAIMELSALAQVERIGLAIPGNIPAMREVWDNALAAVARIAAYQVVEHFRPLRATLAPTSGTATRRTSTGYRRPDVAWG